LIETISIDLEGFEEALEESLKDFLDRWTEFAKENGCKDEEFMDVVKGFMTKAFHVGSMDTFLLIKDAARAKTTALIQKHGYRSEEQKIPVIINNNFTA
jgi:hypothetical protein